MERMERDVKAKNLELADMIRERDRARFDLDRIKASQKEEFDRLKRDLMFANERAEDATRAKSSELSGMMSTLNRQIAELEDSLREKRMELDARDAELARIRDEKDAELAIMQEGMDATIKQLTDMQLNQGESDQAVNAQIDTLILDNSKKLNAIIDSILQACVDKVDDALYELESPSASGNTTATPEYVLSMIEKGTTSTNEFATVFSLYLSGEVGGEHVEVIKRANQLAQTISDTLTSTKGITRLAQNDDAADKLIGTGRETGNVLLRFFSNLQSYRLAGVAPASAAMWWHARTGGARRVWQPQQRRRDHGQGGQHHACQRQRRHWRHCGARDDERCERNRCCDGQAAGAAVEAEGPQQVLGGGSAGARRHPRGFARHHTRDRRPHQGGDRVAAGDRGQGTRLVDHQQFYKKNNRWTEGLISAARAVAFATTMLIEAADGVIMGTHSLEQLIVASNEVSAATAQVVAASRVKAEFMSKTQDRLERAAKAVTDACRALVKQVKTITDRQSNGAADFDYSQMAVHEFKVKEMEQQVEVLKLEKELTQARRVLGAMRRAGYHATEED